MVASPLRYSLFSGLVLGVLWPLAAQGERLPLLPALLLLPIAAVPAWLALAYPATVRRIDTRSALRPGVAPWWGPLLGGALLRQVLAVPVALLAAWSLCWRLVAEGSDTLAWAAGAAAAVYVAAALLARRVGALRAYAQPRPVLVAAPWAAAAILTLAWTLAAGPGPGADATLAERLAAEPRYEGTSRLLAWAVDGMGLLNGAGAWARDWAAERGAGLPALIWEVAGAFGQFWLLALVFAGFLLPPGAGARILRPTDADLPGPVGPWRAALAAGAATILLLFAMTLLARLEAWAVAFDTPRPLAEVAAPLPPEPGAALPASALGADEPTAVLAPRPLSTTEVRRLLEAERLDDRLCPEGTLARLEGLDGGIRALLAAQRERIEGAAREGFDAMRANVPAYLDWYYSLPAEYARTGHLLAGDAEAYLEARLREHLEAGEPVRALRAALADLEGNPQRIAAWRQEREALLGACRDARLPSDAGVVAVAAAAPGAVLAGPAVEALDLRLRLGGASVAGAAGGLVGMAVGKLLAKEAFGLAAEALAKLALGKAAGWLGGATAGAGGGALVGSVVPGIGTTIGAAVGGVVGGVGAWIATDYVLLALEEAVSRDAFAADLLRAIDEAEAEFLASLG